MAESIAQRKLSAILSADVKGYSKLMGEDEVHTVETLTLYQNIIIDLIKTQHGRVVNTPGDNILAEFSSALHAVKCAIAIQKTIEEENQKLEGHRQMIFRIGINLGDILHHRENIYGDGVNIASRIEKLADPGGICISRGVFDQVKKNIAHGFEYLGEHAVKNIPEPIRIYRILLSSEDEGKILNEEPSSISGQRRAIFITSIALLICIAFAGWFFVPTSDQSKNSDTKKMSYALPEHPSIAVLPFTNMSEDPDKEYFSDGMTEHIITSLSKVPYLLVIARNSSFSYKNRFVNVQQIAEELGVQYILEGSVQRYENRVRVTAQLIDSTEGYHLWAETYDREIEDIFNLQDEIAMKIMAKMQVELTVDELGRLSSTRTDNIKAYEKYLMGYEVYQRRTEKDTQQARNLALEAISLDPEYGAPYILLARTYLDDVWYYKTNPKKSLLIAEEHVKMSIALSGQNSMTHQILGSLYYLRRQYDEAIVECEKALELMPNSAQAHYFYGHALRWAGRFPEAITAFEKAIRLNPITPLKYVNNLAWAYAYNGNLQKAIYLWNQAISRNQDYFFAHLGLTFAYQLTDQKELARKEAREVLRIKPKITISKIRKGPATRGIDRERIHTALRDAGIPEE